MIFEAAILLLIIVLAGAFGFGLRQAFIPVPPPRLRCDLPNEAIARIVHEANRAFCVNNGDFSHKAWNNTEPHVRLSTIQGVAYLRAKPHLTPEQMHDNWCMSKIEQGYRYGPVKCHRARTHPCLVPYHMLPQQQQFKDHLFHAIVSLFAQKNG